MRICISFSIALRPLFTHNKLQYNEQNIYFLGNTVVRPLKLCVYLKHYCSKNMDFEPIICM